MLKMFVYLNLWPVGHRFSYDETLLLLLVYCSFFIFSLPRKEMLFLSKLISLVFNK